MQYYILDLSDIKVPREGITDKYYPFVEKEIIDYVIQKGFNCFRKEDIDNLSFSLNLSFQETLRDVFVTFLDMEHEVTKRTCWSKEDSKSNSFIDSYLKIVNNCKDPKKLGKCEDLTVLHREDIMFLYDGVNKFLSDTLEWGNKQPTEIIRINKENNRYKQIVLLLDRNNDYLGHIYIWSYLAINNKYFDTPFTLEFGGIRTNLKNLLCGGTKGIASLFISIIADWCKKYGWEYMRIAFKPIGPMPIYLNKCGFDKGEGLFDRYHIKIEDIKCQSDMDYNEINRNTDMFAFLDSSPDKVEEWYSKKRRDDDSLLRNMWFDNDIARDFHKVFYMSYTDRQITEKELEWLFIDSFDELKQGYRGRLNANEIEEPTTLEEYIELRRKIKRLINEDGERLVEWLSRFSFDNNEIKETYNSKFTELKNLSEEVEKEINNLRELEWPTPMDVMEPYKLLEENKQEDYDEDIIVNVRAYSFTEDNYVNQLKKVFSLKYRVKEIELFIKELSEYSKGLLENYSLHVRVDELIQIVLGYFKRIPHISINRINGRRLHYINTMERYINPLTM